MRNLKLKDIFPETYSNSNGEIIKNELNAVKYFRNKYSMLLSTESNYVNLLYAPSRKYEIFTLDVCGGKTFLVPSSELPDGDNRELYYNFEIANEIYQKLIDIKDCTFNDYQEINDIYEREILQSENEIEELKLRDKEMFEKDKNAYNIISQTPLYENYHLLNEDKKNLIEENEKLNKMVSDYNNKIRDLSQRLKISLDRIEVLQRPKTFWEKVKELFVKDKTQLLLADKKGAE